GQTQIEYDRRGESRKSRKSEYAVDYVDDFEIDERKRGTGGKGKGIGDGKGKSGERDGGGGGGVEEENEKLRGQVSYLKRQVLANAAKLASLPKIISKVPVSVQTTLHMKFQFQQRLKAEMEKNAKLANENRILRDKIRDLQAQVSIRPAKSDTASKSELIILRKNMTAASHERTRLEERILQLTRALDLLTKDKSKLSKELESLREINLHKQVLMDLDMVPVTETVGGKTKGKERDRNMGRRGSGSSFVGGRGSALRGRGGNQNEYGRGERINRKGGSITSGNVRDSVYRDRGSFGEQGGGKRKVKSMGRDGRDSRNGSPRSPKLDRLEQESESFIIHSQKVNPIRDISSRELFGSNKESESKEDHFPDDEPTNRRRSPPELPSRNFNESSLRERNLPTDPKLKALRTQAEYNVYVNQGNKIINE
ncbi:hypothetical protein HDU76_009097, partial [Blyttiomyces sp. JEL0837]